MSSQTLEQRVAQLEAQLLQIMVLLKTERIPAPNWIDRLTGSISNDDLFLEALEYGRSFRVADQPSDETV
jgi:hypothetical protein